MKSLLPQTKHRWLSLVTLPLKVGVLFGALALYLFHWAVDVPGAWPSAVHKSMKIVCEPVAFGCVVAMVLLLTIGSVELVHRRRKEAIWDFAFALIALIVWIQTQGTMSPVK